MNIILFDKQDITRLGVETLIATLYPQEHTLFFADTKHNLVQNLVANPDSLVVIDYALSDLNSVDSLLNISIRFPKTHWVLFSEDLSLQFLKKILCNSEFSVVLKNADFSEIKKALSLALDKQAFVCSQVKELLAMSDKGNTGNNDPLTLTEKEILREIALGKTAKEIADLRHISTHTVVTHRKNIYRKLEINNSQEACGYALRAGIIDTSDYYI
ncbi:MAG: response regulator transcription factor [Prevotellaceae bacterium]|jgi:DNA-binding NarL/FixJ family response regulator|nr:response regulator transcription factor [Prevotellaceae bacterium]